MPDHIKQIMVAGSDGYIGRSIVEFLGLKHELSTIGYYDKKTSSTYSGDLNDPSFIEEVAANCIKPEVLVFLVGLAHKKGKGAELDLFEAVNYQTLVNLLTGLEKVNKLPGKIIFSSTISVYGERNEISEYNENIRPEPFSPYAQTKLKAEKYLIEKYPERSWVLRFAPVYSQSFMLNIERRVKIGSSFYRVGTGDVKLSLCNLQNILCAVESIVGNQVPAGVYNISDCVEYSYNEIIRAMDGDRVLPIPKILVRLVYLLGKASSNIFLEENTLKLLKDNVFPSSKIRQFIELPYGIRDL